MDFEPALAFIKQEIEKEIQGRASVPEGFLLDFVSTKSGISQLLDDDIQGKLIRFLETYFWTKNSKGHTLSIDFESWYPHRKLDDDFQSYYWDRLEKYWLDYSVIPRDSIRATDEVTNEIIDYLGNPFNNESWLRRGLVMGHVQSGKTTNYSALIAKAADAGYRIIVVLAGLTNSLRKQTQERLDKTFVGKSSLGDDINNEFYPVSRVMRDAQGYIFRAPFCGTTQMRDFNVAILRGISAQEGNFAEPILFVIKKHVGVLERLTTWLGNLREGGQQLDGPMLVIDDEADNASVNTTDSDNSVTRTNERIRQLIRCARRTSYVGYTATPFANIFIHPDSNSEMLGDNLFPEHFIKSLDPPDNYIGAKDLFLDGGRLSNICVREIPDDYLDLLPLNHKSTHILEELPKSLVSAIYQYFLFRAIRSLEGETASHSSMMINVSRFNNVQATVRDLVEDLKRVTQEHVQSWAKSSRWEVSKILKEIQSEWHREYEAICDYKWDDVRVALATALAPIEISLVNMRGQALDYSSRKDRPLHVIAIGGLALARGLTLEGLAISYILRNVGAGDTLLQLGRWFGYRPGHEYLCRIHLTDEMLGHFTHVSESVEELRDDLVRMEKLGRTPGEFGLKVRESPTGIAITAANKMRSTEPILLAADYKERHIQAYEIRDDADLNQLHLKFVSSLFKNLMENFPEGYSGENGALVWRGVPSDCVVSFLEKLEFPQMDFIRMNNERSLIIDYIQDRALYDRSMDKWTIAIPYATDESSSGVNRIEFPLPLSNHKLVFCRQRLSGVRKEKLLKITNKNVVADFPMKDLVWGEDKQEIQNRMARLRNENSEEIIRDTKAILCCRDESILLIHLFRFALKTEEAINLKDDYPTVSVSLGFTSTGFKPLERQYAASVRMMEQLELLSLGDEDDLVTDDD